MDGPSPAVRQVSGRGTDREGRSRIVADKPQVVVIGAGPAGLTAAFELVKREVPVTVVEGDAMVGGISRTAEREGWRFDIGGHRFFTKVPEVEALWHEILPDEDFLMRPRMSRIYYRGKFYDYPLKAANALGNLGVIEAIRCVLSYGWARVRPPKNTDTLEGWIIARFGRRLYDHFFKTYNEKLWGVPVDELPADFAAQRIKNMSLFNAIMNALKPKTNQKEITSLIEEFQYPKYGPGMMWETRRREGRGARAARSSSRRRSAPSTGKRARASPASPRSSPVDTARAPVPRRPPATTSAASTPTRPTTSSARCRSRR